MWPLSLSLILLITSCATHERYPESGYGTASWYGREFHGRPTSSGEPFNMYALTCAHKEYPFGTKLRITNISNAKSAECLVNDRGPFVSGRDIDLSYATAKEIGLLGTGLCKVRIDYLGRDMSYVREVRYSSYSGPFTIQIGAFKEASNASRLKAGLELRYKGVYISEAVIRGDRFYRVRIGKFLTREAMLEVAKSLAQEGYRVLVSKYDEKT